MVEISLSGSGEGPGWATAPGYSTAAFSAPPRLGALASRAQGARSGLVNPHFSRLTGDAGSCQAHLL